MNEQPKDVPPGYQQTYQTMSNPQMFSSGPAHVQQIVTPSTVPNGTQAEFGNSDIRITQRLTSDEEEDIYRVDGNVKVGFEDVFPEPSAYDKLAPVRHILGLTFHYVQLGLYGFLMVTVGMFLAVFWALTFGFLNFSNTWFIQPFVKACFVLMRAYAVVFRAATRSFCDPLYSSMGLALANMRGRFKLAVTGVQPESRSESSAVREV